MTRRTFDLFIDLDKLNADDEAQEIARQLRRVALHIEKNQRSIITHYERPINVSGVRVGRAGYRSLEV